MKIHKQSELTMHDSLLIINFNPYFCTYGLP